MAASDASKTEEATPEKRRRAREEGQFARGRDAGGVAATAMVLALVVGVGGSLSHMLYVFAMRCFQSPSSVHGVEARGPLDEMPLMLVALTFPPALAAAAGAVAIGFAEAGFQPRIELIFPKFERMNPLSRLGSLFSPKNAAVEIVLSVARVGAVGLVAYYASRDALPKLIALCRSDVVSSASLMGEVATSLVVRCTLALGVLSGVDYVYNRYKISQQLMMSRQEIKEEFKNQEGDPRTKARMRQIGRDRLRRGLAAAIKKADVVLANPTHISVALRYRPKDGAPIVLAKGYDEIALYMRTLARKEGVPIVENKPLARALAARVKVNKAIPADLYGAVAEVLAFVYRIKNKRL